MLGNFFPGMPANSGQFRDWVLQCAGQALLQTRHWSRPDSCPQLDSNPVCDLFNFTPCTLFLCNAVRAILLRSACPSTGSEQLDPSLTKKRNATSSNQGFSFLARLIEVLLIAHVIFCLSVVKFLSCFQNLNFSLESGSNLFKKCSWLFFATRRAELFLPPPPVGAVQCRHFFCPLSPLLFLSGVVFFPPFF